MAQVRSTTTAAPNENASSLSLAIPNGTVNGDLLVAFLSHKNGGGDFFAPAGWTAAAERENASGWNASKVFWKIAANEGTSVAFTTDSIDRLAGQMLRIDGHDAGDPIDAVASAHDRSSSATASVAPSVATSKENALVLSLHANREVAGVVSGSQPSGYNQIVIAESGFGACAASAERSLASPGNTGSASWPLRDPGQWTAWTIAINSASGGAQPGPDPIPEGGAAPVVKGLYIKSGEGDESGIPGQTYWDAVDSSPRIRGACVIIFWFNIETAFDVYQFDVIDNAIAECQAIGKRCTFELRIHSYGASAEEPHTVGVPEYLYRDHSTYGGNPGAGGLARKHKSQYSIRVWDPNVMDRVAKLYEKVFEYCADKPVDMIVGPESTPGAIDSNNPDASDYTVSACLEQYRIMIERATKAAGASTRFCFLGNFIKFGNNSQGGDLDTVYDYCYVNDAGWSSPDPRVSAKPNNGEWGNIFRMHQQRLAGRGTANSPADVPYMPLGEQGAGGFTDLSGYLTGNLTLLDMMLYLIEQCQMVYYAVTINYKADSAYKNEPLGWREIVDLIDEPALSASDRKVLQDWAEAPDVAGGIVGPIASMLPALTQQAAGVMGNSADQTLPALTQQADGINAGGGAAVQTLPALTQQANGAMSDLVDWGYSVLPPISQAGVGNFYHWAPMDPAEGEWRPL